MTLSSFKNALTTCGVTPVDLACIGDSITEGMVAPHRENAWPQELRDLLRAKRFSGATRGGIGYCPSYSVSASVGDFWSKSAGVTLGTLNTGLGCRMLKVPSGEQIALTFTGTGLDLLYTVGSNSIFTYNLDGLGDITVDARDGGDIISGTVLSLRGLCEKAHTVVIKGTAAGSAYIEGAMVYRGDETGGVRVWEGGHSGWTCADYNATDRWHGSLQAIPNLGLAIVCLGANEYIQGITSAQYATALTTLLATVANLVDAPILVMSPHARMPISGRANQSVYEAAAATVAAGAGADYLSMSPVIGDAATAIANGWIESGLGTHPTTLGHARYAQAIADFIS